MFANHLVAFVRICLFVHKPLVCLFVCLFISWLLVHRLVVSARCSFSNTFFSWDLNNIQFSEFLIVEIYSVSKNYPHLFLVGHPCQPGHSWIRKNHLIVFVISFTRTRFLNPKFCTQKIIHLK